MKWLLVLSAVLVAFTNAQDTCYSESIQGCNSQTAKDDLLNCNALFSGFPKHVKEIQRYANHQIEKSFEYLLLAANFGTYIKNRPGFEKQFRSLSDKSWGNGIELIKHITKRGGAHDFNAVPNNRTEKKQILDLNELNALALTLDYEKTLALEAHRIHEKYSHARNQAEYDPEIAHFIEEEFIENQAGTIRKLSGYTNDLKKLLKEYKDTNDVSLALYLFDEYLVKQE
jgi:ferritin heavy chain